MLLVLISCYEYIVLMYGYDGPRVDVLVTWRRMVDFCVWCSTLFSFFNRFNQFFKLYFRHPLQNDKWTVQQSVYLAKRLSFVVHSSNTWSSPHLTHLGKWWQQLRVWPYPWHIWRWSGLFCLACGYLTAKMSKSWKRLDYFSSSSSST